MIQKNMSRIRNKFFGDLNANILLTNNNVKSIEFDLARLAGLVDRVQNLVLRAEERLKHLDTRIVNSESKLLNSGTIVLSDKEIITKIFSGIKLSLDPRDVAVAIHIALDGIWEEQITKAWMKLVGERDTILDIGANFGYFGVLAAQKTSKKKSKVVFFEANPNLIPYINKTLDINWLNEQCSVVNNAISNRSGTVTLNILEDYIGCATLQSIDHLGKYMDSKMHLKLGEAIKVPAITIDEYCSKNNIKTVDLIKMDIEGFEDKAYEGMRKTVAGSPNLKLFIEFTKDGYENPKQFFKTLKQDFEYIYLINKDGDIYNPKDKSYNSIVGGTDDWVMPIFSKKKLV